MAEDEVVDETSQISATDSSDDDSEEEQIETLVAGRERRRTAGNRYDRDMVLEEAGDGEDADEVALLFADNEQEEDDEFNSGDDDEDADMSSSDDDDQGPNATVDDMEGEKELQKQAKAERARKRKADLALTSVAGLRKKLKTDPTRPAAITAPAKPSKKKERVTWVHDPDSGRSSLRKQTIAHRAETIARLKESEAQSKKLKALKEQRDRERAKDAPKELTQADRLAEAARIERQNAKSLNRWEALEKKRQEEQAAKLAALKNRKLEGPVITWWSAKATWVGPKLSKIGTKDAGEIFEAGTEPKKRGRKSKAFLEQQAAEKAAQYAVPSTTATSSEPSATSQPKPDVPETAPTEGLPTTPSHPDAATPMELDSNQPPEHPSKPDQSVASETALPTQTPSETPASPMATTSKPSPAPGGDIENPHEAMEEMASKQDGAPPAVEEDSVLNGIQEYADMPTESNASGSRHGSPDPKTAAEPEKTVQISDPEQVKAQTRPEQEKKVSAETASTDTEFTEIKTAQEPSLETEAKQTSEPPDISVSNPVPNSPVGGAPVTNIQSDPPQASPQVDPQKTVVKVEGSTEAPLAAAAPQPEPTVEYSTRNIVILETFDELSDDGRRDYALFYNKTVKKVDKRVKHVQELCPITALPVRYRDPGTGIGYANVVGYQKLQDLKQHRYIWSSMLGCYVGREGGPVARGVPEGFADKA
ncbi:hypothetical protein PV08_10110 [Exophiala spinifera]|uniref:Vps72/YL1 C-terminal domain-containing protein n=1 Tax=Exophiala spinifera TaxID=91928 RepID=A0A0D1Y7C0_9EURO|nr:uncharacterized protein PV08_10110 [Exophiala spinifera]KIW10811.1 hypothetical protein PV08_10110 [Exophiala spinifera]